MSYCIYNNKHWPQPSQATTSANEKAENSSLAKCWKLTCFHPFPLRKKEALIEESTQLSTLVEKQDEEQEKNEAEKAEKEKEKEEGYAGSNSSDDSDPGPTHQQAKLPKERRFYQQTDKCRKTLRLSSDQIVSTHLRSCLCTHQILTSS